MRPLAEMMLRLRTTEPPKADLYAVFAPLIQELEALTWDAWQQTQRMQSARWRGDMTTLADCALRLKKLTDDARHAAETTLGVITHHERLK